MTVTSRPRRSCLYMPGANQRALEKAATLAVDVLMLDLEDAVAPEAKVSAREAVCARVRERAYGDREVIVRINALDTAWGADDLGAVVAASPDGMLVPKITCASEVYDLDSKLTAAGASVDLGLWVMIETPLAILNINDIAATAIRTRLLGFVVGTNDLAKELGAASDANRSAFQVQLALTLTAARAYGLAAIDGVYNDFRDHDGLERECEQGRLLGFDGKSLIHPAQLEISNRIFSPEPVAIEHARAIIAAFDLPQNRGQGVITVEGKMVELLHLEQARRLVAIHESITARE